MSTELKKITRAVQLITLPEVYLKLKKLLDEPDYTMAEVAEVISYDSGLTARLLRIVNSCLYGLFNKVETVNRAITLIGTQQLHDMVLATSVAQVFAGLSTEVMDIRRFWRRSVYCAVAARQMAAYRKGCQPELLFVAGLLHDLGHLVMYQAIPDAAAQALRAAEAGNQPLHKIERELIGFNSTEVSAELLSQWSLPESLTEIVSCHLEPWTARNYPQETALVYLAALLAQADDAQEGKETFKERLLSVDPGVLETSGLNVEDCQAVAEQADTDVQEVVHLFLPRGRG